MCFPGSIILGRALGLDLILRTTLHASLGDFQNLFQVINLDLSLLVYSSCDSQFYASISLGHGAKILDQTLFSKCLCEDIFRWDLHLNQWDLSEACCPPQCGWASSTQLNTWIEQKTDWPLPRAREFSSSLSTDFICTSAVPCSTADYF